MSCQEIRKELATPTGTVTHDAVCDHLHACRSCAAWAQDRDALDRVWRETRPVEPSADVLDALVSRACLSASGGSLASPPSGFDWTRPAARPSAAPHWRFRLAAPSLAAAALVACSLIAEIRTRTPEPTALASRLPVLHVAPEQTIIVRLNNDQVDVESVDALTPHPDLIGQIDLADANDHDMLSRLESLAE